MEKKYVLILGAGLMQRPSLEAAKELGYKTLVVDANPKALCAKSADRFEPIDLKDKEKIAQFALSMKNEIAGVFTAGTDFSASVSYVSEKLGLPCHAFEAAVNASNKVKMRKCFESNGVSSPDFMEVHRNQIADFLKPELKQKMTYPCVAKPVDNMGARGCRMVRNSSELIPALEDAIRSSRSGKVILEDYMEGPEFSIDAVVYKGTLTITGFADRHIYFPPYFIETGHTMSTIIDEKKKQELILCFAKGVKSLGLTCGVAKADIKYTEKGPMVGEIAARLSGGYMSGWTFPYASGLNLTKEALKIALGQEPDILIKNRIELNIENSPFKLYEYPALDTCAERAWISIPGKIKNIYGLNEMDGALFVKNAFPRSKVGDTVDFPRNNVEKCGNVITLSKNYKTAVEAAEQAVSNVVLRLEIKNSETEKFLKCHEKRAEKGFPYSAYEFNEELTKQLSEWTKKNVSFKKHKALIDQLPDFIVPYLDEQKDFNHRSLRKTLELYEELAGELYPFTTKEFFDALKRGGIQGLLYINDMALQKEKQ